MSDPILLPPGARAVLTGPDFVARGLAAADRDPQRRWILRRPREVRRAFVSEVIDRPATRSAGCSCRTTRPGTPTSRRWAADRQAIWLLRQPRKVRESYVADVIDG